jgi:predicted enzyme related to lactoylglutathione lyase
MNIRGVDFVFYPTSDYERAMTFYRDTLGLKIGKEMPGVYAEFEVGAVTLMVGKYGDTPKDGKQWGGATVALAVPDLAKSVAELKAKNVTITMETAEYGPCFMAMFSDPDGNQIMFHQRKDGTVG